MKKEDAEVDILQIDNAKVRQAQVRRLEEVRRNRDESQAQATLSRLAAAATNGGNLLKLSIDAVRQRATVGEVSSALERSWGRHQAVARVTKGVYGGVHANGEAFQQVVREVKVFTEFEGRAPSILVVKLGQDGHDRGAKVICNAFSDMGFATHVGALFQTPEEAAADAVRLGVHVVGFSTLAGGHRTLAPQLTEALRKLGQTDMVVVCGGVIPQQDHQFLLDAGVSAVFGPVTNIPQAASEVLKLIPGKNR